MYTYSSEYSLSVYMLLTGGLCRENQRRTRRAGKKNRKIKGGGGDNGQTHIPWTIDLAD